MEYTKHMEYMKHEIYEKYVFHILFCHKWIKLMYEPYPFHKMSHKMSCLGCSEVQSRMLLQ